MLYTFYDNAAPEPMTPAHAELQSNAPAAPDATFNLQRLGRPIKLSAWATFYHAKPAVQTINHPFDQRIRDFFRHIPES
jgi:hypothetical protein